MSEKFSIVVFGMLVLFASQGWAGSMGNGAAQRASMAGGYTFCYAGDSKSIYFTKIMTLAPTAKSPNLGGIYGDYIKKTYGLSDIDRQRCITATTNVNAEAIKQRFKKTFGPAKFIETKWIGNLG